MVLRQDESLGGAGNMPPPTPARPRLPAARPAVCPFKGLASFDTGDAEYFCGRDRVVSELVARRRSPRWWGSSARRGSGSPRAARRAAPGARAPARCPAAPAGGRCSCGPASIRCGARPRAGRRRPGGGRAAARPARRMVIAVDQLEEVFTPGCGRGRAGPLPGPARRRGAGARAPRARAVRAARRLLRAARRPSALRRAAQPQPRPGRADGPRGADRGHRGARRARRAVDRAHARRRAGGRGADEPGGLPLLSTALLELWRARDGHTLRFDAYRRSGGVRGAVGRLAEAAYGQLNEPERRAARNVMLRLVAGEEGALGPPAGAAGRAASASRRRARCWRRSSTRG